MAYEPTVWQTGDVITAAKLNKAEQGIADADAGILVELTETLVVDVGKQLDASYTDLMNATQAGKIVRVIVEDLNTQIAYLCGLYYDELDTGTYIAQFMAIAAAAEPVIYEYYSDSDDALLHRD